MDRIDAFLRGLKAEERQHLVEQVLGSLSEAEFGHMADRLAAEVLPQRRAYALNKFLTGLKEGERAHVIATIRRLQAEAAPKRSGQVLLIVMLFCSAIVAGVIAILGAN